MIKILLDKYDKAQIQHLPKDNFAGRIVVVEEEKDVDQAVDYLLRQDILGFDTETRPSFRKGKLNAVALLQVATHDVCFLFRLNKIGMPRGIIRLLTDQRVLKVALSWRDDLCSLCRRKKFECAPFVELQDYAAELGIQDMSLQKLYANVFGKRIAKTQQLTNWENDELTPAQQLYAATDAWACVVLYEEMTRLKEIGDYILYVQEPISEEG